MDQAEAFSLQLTHSCKAKAHKRRTLATSTMKPMNQSRQQQQKQHPFSSQRKQAHLKGIREIRPAMCSGTGNIFGRLSQSENESF